MDAADVITVDGTSAAAIDRALAEAGPGDTVYLPAGTYVHDTLAVPDGVSLRGAGIDKTRCDFALTFGSSSTISRMLVAAPNNSVAISNRQDARDTLVEAVRFRGGGPKPGVTYSASATTYLSYNPVVELGGKGTRRSLSHVTFRDCEFERPSGSYLSRYVRANTVSMWEDNRAGYAHIEYLTFERCHFGAKNPSGEYGAITSNVELKTNSYGDGSFDHNWHDVVLRDCIAERSGDFNLDFTDAARSYLRAKGMVETGNWAKVPMGLHAGHETGRSVSMIGGQIKGCGVHDDGWTYVFCLENPIGATLSGVTIWGGNRPNPEPESASPACGPVLGRALPAWPLPLAYDLQGMIAVYGNSYTPGVFGPYTPSPYDP